MGNIDIDFSDMVSDIAKSLNITEFNGEIASIPDELIKDIMKDAGSKEFDNYQKMGGGPYEAADKFVSVLYSAVINKEGTNYADGEISHRAADVIASQMLENITISDPIYYLDKTQIHVTISDGSNMSRSSLLPEKYPNGVDNILDLLDSGYSAKGRVRGLWHGDTTWSLKQRKGSNFFGGVISDFIGNYGSDYGVVSVRYDSIDDYMTI